MAALAELNRVLPIHRSPAAAPAKRMVFEPLEDDEDWAAQIALAEAEAEEDNAGTGRGVAPEDEDVDLDLLREIEAHEREAREEETRQPVGTEQTAGQGTSAGGWGALRASEAGQVVKKDDKGKGRMILEEDDGFGAFGEEEFGGFAARPPPPPPGAGPSRPLAANSHTHDYTSRFGAVSSLNLSLRPGWIEAAPVQATRLDGRQFFLKRRKKLEHWAGGEGGKKENTAALAELATSMLEQPYHRIMQSIEHDITMEKKRKEADAANPAISTSVTTIETMLWTDRYRPKRFVDLLGDERLHRTALLWLKEWDACVFKDTAKANAAAEMKRQRSKKRARDGHGDGNGNGAKEGGGFEEAAPDPYGRPQEKILLLSGPPGLGKTTLAHVLARQAGYQVLEINASDDRTGGVVEQRIRNALESSALTVNAGVAMKKGKDETIRPTCVVVDEVDGAGGGGESSFVKTLVKLIMEGSSTKKPNRKGKGKQPRPLLRPIVCICNDLYAPVLRPLRPLAKIVRFAPPTSAMLVKRLRTICDVEQLTTENKHLSLLVDTAEGDLRSCLNTLQFIKRNGSVVDPNAIRSSALGAKDTGTSSAQVLDRLFKKPARKRGAPAEGGIGSDEKFVHRIVRDVQTSGEYEKISQGCFENYLTARGSNAEAFPRLHKALDWLFLYDSLDSRLRTEREYELLAYVPYSFAPWYQLFSSQVAKPVERPKTDYE
ncbi:hypothetical protein JCM11641_005682, partial [Rhodosporidiobolus odoratus]